MKIKNSPKSLQNLPKGYSLDTGDYKDINKYRENKARKNRSLNRLKSIIKTWMKETT